jgi:adenylate cyclase
MPKNAETGPPSAIRDETLSFGPFRLDLSERSLLRDGAAVPLGGRALDLLAALAQAGGQIVGKDAIYARVWPGLAVEENNIQVQVSTLRKALGEEWIQTVPGRGYRLVMQDAGAPAAVAHAPARPTLAVLPFVNLSGAADQEYFADALTEEITTAVSRVRWFQVIARSSAFAYRGRSGIDVREVGRALGARYVLEGSVLRAGPRIRMAGSLIDAETGVRLWADRFEGEGSDLFGLQDRLGEAVVGHIEPNLRNAEISRARARPTGRLDAYDHYLRALPLTWEGTRESFAQAVGHLKQAVAMDQNFVVAKAFLAFTLMNQAGLGWGEADTADLGARMATEALLARSDEPEALRRAGHVAAFFARDRDRALVAVQRALALSPNSIGTLMSAGWVHCYRLEGAEAVPLFERALRLNPYDEEGGYVLSGLGLAQLILERPEQALPVLQRSVHDMPNWAPGHQFLAVALSWLGREDEARAVTEGLMARMPRLRARTEKWAFPPGPWLDGFLAALRDAGVPP